MGHRYCQNMKLAILSKIIEVWISACSNMLWRYSLCSYTPIYFKSVTLSVAEKLSNYIMFFVPFVIAIRGIWMTLHQKLISSRFCQSVFKKTIWQLGLEISFRHIQTHRHKHLHTYTYTYTCICTHTHTSAAQNSNCLA